MSARSLLDLTTLSADEVKKLYSVAERLSHEGTKDRSYFDHRRGLTGALVFFEPSTRTRLSFETACARAGLRTIGLHGSSGSSLEKGETFEDTLANVAALGPSLLVIRSGDELDMAAMAKRLPMPILNAGWGRRGHPTQALLDLFCLWREGRDLSQERLLICGDVRHSRVASSHFELARLLGVKIALCGPETFMPEAPAEGVTTFSSLEKGLEWATSVMALRVQLERHRDRADLSDFSTRWGISAHRLSQLPPSMRLLHPGPVNWGVELSQDVLEHPSCRILQQVQGGVWIRQTLIERALGELS